MKLLSPTQNSDVKAQELTREVIRTQEIYKEADKARKSLANEQSSFNRMLARNREQWAKEEEEHQNRLLEMKHEVQILENRKKQALIPLEVYKKQAQDLFNLAQDAKNRAESHEKELEVVRDRLEDKLDEVGQKTVDLDNLEQRLYIQKQGIEIQTKQIQESSKKLSQELQAFADQKAKDEQDILERKKTLKLWEHSLSAKERQLNNIAKGLMSKEKRLKDEREVLNRERKRLSS